MDICGFKKEDVDEAWHQLSLSLPAGENEEYTKKVFLDGVCFGKLSPSSNVKSVPWEPFYTFTHRCNKDKEFKTGIQKFLGKGKNLLLTTTSEQVHI